VTGGTRSVGDDELIAAALRSPDPGGALVGLLDERGAHHRGRTTVEVAQLRGRVLAPFESLGHLPGAAQVYALEELESGLDPSNLAAAGRALRVAGDDLPPEAGPLLVAAITRVRGKDDRVRFESSCCGAPGPTALADLAETLSRLGPAASAAHEPLAVLLDACGADLAPGVRADLGTALDAVGAPAPSPCCGGRDDAEVTEADGCEGTGTGTDIATGTDVATALGAIVLDDQDGAAGTFADRFGGRPSAISFFYTRCTNPERCSLTVSRLARLARRVHDIGLDANVAGISYDPRYDRPERLRTYGLDRGMAFSPRCSLLRSAGSFDPFVDALELGVGFGPVTVNQHRLDVVVLDADLQVRARRARRQWTEDDLLDDLVDAGARPLRTRGE
jgi:protein SCO1/2